MSALLSLAHAIDRFNAAVARAAFWLVLGVTLISAGNAVVRKLFGIGSNALLEIQSYLFSAIFLLCAAHALQAQAHVRIDVIYGRFSRRTQVWIDVFGTLLFLLPVAMLVLWLSWPVFVDAWRSGEQSANAGGLPFWPARLLVPVGFAMLGAQGLSELVKRVAFLRGCGPDPAGGERGSSEEQALAEEIRRLRGLDGEASK